MDNSDDHATTFDTDQVIDVRTIGDLKQLIELLESADIDVDEIPINLAMQPGWPLAYSIRAAVLQYSEDGDPELWLVEGGQLGYLPNNVHVTLGW